MVKLSSVAEILNGDRSENYPSGKDFIAYGIPFINAGHLKNGKIDFSHMDYISKQKYEQLSGAKIQTKDILLCLRGSLGKHAVAEIDAGAPASSIAVIRPNEEIIAPKFLTSIISSFIFQKQIDLENNGSSQPNLSASSVANFIIPLPPLEEQKLIAEALSDVDSMISSLEKLIAKKKAVKQGVMQELLTGKKRLKGFSEDWQVEKLEEYCSLITKQTGFDYSAYIKPALTKRKNNNTLPMIQTINFRGKHFDFNTDYYIPVSVAENFSNIILKTKCILFSIVGASVGNIGLYPGGVSFCGGAIGITRFYEEDDADWVYYYMSSSEGQAQIQYVTKGGAQATVTIADIRNFSIPTPPKEERVAITALLSDMDNEIEALEQKLAKTRQIKQGMMQQLLTGKIRLV